MKYWDSYQKKESKLFVGYAKIEVQLNQSTFYSLSMMNDRDISDDFLDRYLRFLKKIFGKDYVFLEKSNSYSNRFIFTVIDNSVDTKEETENLLDKCVLLNTYTNYFVSHQKCQSIRIVCGMKCYNDNKELAEYFKRDIVNKQVSFQHELAIDELVKINTSANEKVGRGYCYTEFYEYNYIYADVEGYVIEHYCGIEPHVTVPDRASDGTPIIAIGKWAFCKNQFIRSVTIPDGILSLYGYLFAGCDSLEFVQIGSGVQYLSPYCIFSECKQLKEIRIDEQNERYEAVQNCVIEKATKTLIAGCGNSEIPDGVKSIGAFAFANCVSLKQISIPESVEHIGMSAFIACSSLGTIFIGNHVKTVEQSAFAGCFPTVILCEAESKPSGWDDYWMGAPEDPGGTNPTVQWGNSLL